jgi:TPR repeat protein
MTNWSAIALSCRREAAWALPWRRSRWLAAFVIVLLGLALLVLAHPRSDGGLATRAAEARGAAAKHELGLALENGRGVQTDYGAALRLFSQAADQGYAPAMTELAFMYEKGRGAPRDYATAAKWYLEAWQRGGDKWAAYKLSQFYANGLGVAKDEAVANFWNTLASGPSAMCG